MGLSQATLDLINKAEDDLTAASAADVVVSQAAATAATANAAVTSAQSAAAVAHTAATSDALAAIAALKAELGLPADASPSSTPNFKGRAKASTTVPPDHPVVKRALAAGLNFGQILNIIVNAGGLTFLENLLNSLQSTVAPTQQP